MFVPTELFIELEHYILILFFPGWMLNVIQLLEDGSSLFC